MPSCRVWSPTAPQSACAERASSVSRPYAFHERCGAAPSCRFSSHAVLFPAGRLLRAGGPCIRGFCREAVRMPSREAAAGREARHFVVQPGGCAGAPPGGGGVGREALHPGALPGGSADAQPGGCCGPGGPALRGPAGRLCGCPAGRRWWAGRPCIRGSCREAVRMPSREAVAGREARHPVVQPGGCAGAPPGGGGGPGGPASGGSCREAVRMPSREAVAGRAAQHPVVQPGGCAGAPPGGGGGPGGPESGGPAGRQYGYPAGRLLRAGRSGTLWSSREAARVPRREAVVGREALHPVFLPRGSAGALSAARASSLSLCPGTRCASPPSLSLGTVGASPRGASPPSLSLGTVGASLAAPTGFSGSAVRALNLGPARASPPSLSLGPARAQSLSLGTVGASPPSLNLGTVGASLAAPALTLGPACAACSPQSLSLGTLGASPPSLNLGTVGASLAAPSLALGPARAAHSADAGSVGPAGLEVCLSSWGSPLSYARRAPARSPRADRRRATWRASSVCRPKRWGLRLSLEGRCRFDPSLHVRFLLRASRRGGRRIAPPSALARGFLAALRACEEVAASHAPGGVRRRCQQHQQAWRFLTASWRMASAPEGVACSVAARRCPEGPVAAGVRRRRAVALEAGFRRVGTCLPARHRRRTGWAPASSCRFADAGSFHGSSLLVAGRAPG